MASTIRNAARDINRAKSRRLAVETADFEDHPSPAPSPHDTAARKDSLELLNALLEQQLQGLSQLERDAIILHHLRGLPTKEIAAETGRAVGSVKNALVSGRTKLRSSMQSWRDAEDAQ